MVLDLLIKGSPEDAAIAARTRGIGPLTILRDKPGETMGTHGAITVCRVPGLFKADVERWLSEVRHRPYPVGTLITFSERVEA